jgi:general secretion pathway protein A
MTSQPFCERASMEQILKDERFQQGLARLEFLALQGTIAFVIGQTGVGKSTLIKLFLNSLSPSRYSLVYLHLTRMKNTCFLKLIVSGLGESPKMSKEKVFSQILDKSRKSELVTLIVVDEAHLLESEALTDLRLLVSSALDNEPPFKLLLVGQEPLATQLKQARHMDLLQRINLRYHLPPLTKAQTVAYIDHQLLSSGASERIFDSNVKSAIYDYTHGIPRQINNLATACLLEASVQKVQKIDEKIFAQTMSEFQM